MRKSAVVWLVALGGLNGAAVALAGTPRQTARANRHVAVAAARQMLDGVVLPAGASEVATAPTGSGNLLAQPVGRFFFAAQVDRHAFWTTSARPVAVMASIKAHLPAGSRRLQYGYSSSQVFASYDVPTIDHAVLGPRQLVVDALALANGTTAVRVDAEVRYVAPRAFEQRVPPQARVLTITMTDSSPEPPLSLTVTRRSQVRRIAAAVDALPFTGNWRGVAVSCPAFSASAPVDAFIFRAVRGGPVLARVSELAATPAAASPCELTTLTIRGHHEPALMDGGTLLRQAGAVLGVTLTRRG